MLTNNKKNVIIVGGYGSGKTKTALEIIGNRPHVIYQANDIDLDDPYSFPKNHGVIIEDVHYKPMKDKILNIMYVLPNVVLTSLNEKDVPKAVMNMCTRKRIGRIDYRQNKIKELSPNAFELTDKDKSIFDLNMEILKSKDRKKVVDLLKHNKPPDIQILSWVEPNVDVNHISFADSIMRRWSMDYFYEILSYSLSGYHGGRPKFPKRNSYSPVPKICGKLNLKAKDSYLVKSFLENQEYETWAINNLDRDECKILNLKKVRRKQIRVSKTKSLGDF